DVARSVVASPGAQPRHRRNLMIVYGLLGLVDEGRATAPKGLSANEAKKLLARATAIRALSDAKARAKALGTIMSCPARKSAACRANGPSRPAGKPRRSHDPREAEPV